MNSKPIRVLVVEDEPLVLKELVDGLEEDPLIQVCGQAGDVQTAYEQVLSTRPDAIFLDIKLEGGSGFDLLRRLKAENRPVPPVVLNTGHEKFEYAKTAINEFRGDIVNLLQKPFFRDWRSKREMCLQAILSYKDDKDNENVFKDLGILSVRRKNHTFFIRFEKIVYLEVGGNRTVYVITEDHEPLRFNRSMTSLLEELPSYILQISRFNAVNVRAIHSIDHESHNLRLWHKDMTLKIGEGYYSNLMDMI